MFERKWPDGLVIRELTKEDYETWVVPAQSKVFKTLVFTTPDSPDADIHKNALSNREAHANHARRFRIGAFYQSEFAGWHFGRQDGADCFHMSNSGVLPEFRRKQIYVRLLDSVLEWTFIQGYQTVTSCHHPSNNAVIIPKLKKGFCIAGSELTDKIGLLIKMTYFHSPLARKVFEFRSGFIPADEDILQVISPAQRR